MGRCARGQRVRLRRWVNATRPGGPARPVFCFRFSPAPRVSFPFRVQTTPRGGGGKQEVCRERNGDGRKKRHMAALAAPRAGQGPAVAGRKVGRVTAGPHLAEQHRWSLLEP